MFFSNGIINKIGGSMRKNIGKKPLIYPQPVLMIGTYDENGNPDIMNAAWGGVGDDTQVHLLTKQSLMMIRLI